MQPFTDKVALVTGAGKKNGIGFAIARRLALGGARVVITDICKDICVPDYTRFGTFEELQTLADEINGDSLVMDVTDQTTIDGVATAIRDRYGHLDLLVNNAGAAPQPNLLEYIDMAMWQKTMDINVNGTLLVTRAMLPLMIRPDAAIVNISSKAGKRPRAFAGAYCIAKGAIIMLTKVFALELAPRGIRVNAVCPGQIETDLERWSWELEAKAFNKDVETIREEKKSAIPLARIGIPEEVADVTAFLLSNESQYVTGQTINIDGGQLLEL